MFRKLTKYEWKSYAKSMFFLLIAVTAITIIAIASIAVFDASQFDSNSWFAFVNMTTYIGIFLLYYFGIIAISLAAMLIIAVRFYKTMFTDEAYLTHTLPVTRAQLFWSKFCSAFGYYLFTTFLIILSAICVFCTLLFKMSLGTDFINDITELYNEITSEIGVLAIVFYMIFYIGITLISSLAGIMIIFASIILGQNFVKHRIIGSIVCYFIITIIIQILAFVLNFVSGLISTQLLQFEMLSIQYYNVYYFFIGIFNVILFVALTFISLSQLKKNLNLE